MDHKPETTSRAPLGDGTTRQAVPPIIPMVETTVRYIEPPTAFRKCHTGEMEPRIQHELGSVKASSPPSPRAMASSSDGEINPTRLNATETITERTRAELERINRAARGVIQPPESQKEKKLPPTTLEQQIRDQEKGPIRAHFDRAVLLVDSALNKIGAFVNHVCGGQGGHQQGFNEDKARIANGIGDHPSFHQRVTQAFDDNEAIQKTTHVLLAAFSGAPIASTFIAPVMAYAQSATNKETDQRITHMERSTVILQTAVTEGLQGTHNAIGALVAENNHLRETNHSLQQRLDRLEAMLENISSDTYRNGNEQGPVAIRAAHEKDIRFLASQGHRDQEVELSDEKLECNGEPELPNSIARMSSHHVIQNIIDGNQSF